MSDKDRDEVAGRLRALQQVLGYSDAQMANAIGITRQGWSNYVNRGGKNARLISIDGVRQLKAQFGVTSEWVYLGDAAHLTSELRLKLIEAQANPAPVKMGRRAKHR